MTTAEPRRRDAGRTRQLLLDAARRRFADDGYAATTVRDIADDAGVNVALISRYFASKEGLFEACLKSAGEDLRRTTGEVTLDQVPAAMAGHIAGASADGVAGQLALLLRTSGDEAAEQIRREVLRTSAVRLAALAGAGDRQLEAQMVLATAIGVAVLRSTGIEPLATATEAELEAPLRALIRALLRPS